ncbi:MAG: hypothetical protein U9Q82_01585 [Chloroflexota bacterium]|nr:hypothetical protein [Chloroflexota bacterium]
MIQYGHRQTAATSLALAFDKFLPNLSHQAKILLDVLSVLPSDERISAALSKFLRKHERTELARLDIEAAQYELMENLVLEKHVDADTGDEYLRLHRLVSLHAAQHINA